MKLEYNILWFEDDQEQIGPEVDSFRDYLADLGLKLDVEFQPGIDLEKIDDLARKLQVNNKHDLILLDYDLGDENETGDVIAKRLRTKIHTDIVFYSGKELSELRRILYENEVDGVFLASRPSLYDDIVPLLEDHSKKFCSLSTMRGVLLEEFSLIDQQLRKACDTVFQQCTDEERSKVLGKVKEKIKQTIDEMQQFHDDVECPIVALQKYEFVELNQVRIRLRKALPSDHRVADLLKENGPVHRVQMLRNKLAHRIAELKSDGTLSIDGYDSPLDFTKYKEIRKDLLILKTELAPLLQDFAM